MATQVKNYSKKFLEYQEFIVKHPNYKGLPINRRSDGSLSWVAGKQSEIGRKRLEWMDLKIKELGISGDGIYAKLMFQIHPTKEKPCQICGRKLSLRYIYLNAVLIKIFNTRYQLNVDNCTSVYDAYDLLSAKIGEDKAKLFFIDKFDTNQTINNTKQEILDRCEEKCRLDGLHLLGPGAMSNPPDRYDGFHSYNRCCRQTEDLGRHKENMDTYTKDRRAYEYWSDGNIQSANNYMGSSYFDGCSADHVGPISLGFIHDSVNLRRLSISDNSSKRDRLSYDIIKEIECIENRENISLMSWYSQEIWDFIKKDLHDSQKAIENYQNMLKQNMRNFMAILKFIKDQTGESGIDYLTKTFLEPKKEYFQYTYKWDENGHIIEQSPRKENDSNRKEYERLVRVSFESIDDFNKKYNRRLNPELTKLELVKLSEICELIQKNEYASATDKLKKLMCDIEERIIQGKLHIPE